MTAKPSVFPSVGRLLVYGVLALATAFFLLPLYAMLVTSFKDAEEIRSTSLLALPGSLDWSAWGTAWSTACTGVDCNGLRPFFWNSVAMAVPAVLISTVWGALNGYVLSLWKFRGSDTLFGLLLFGVFMPFQVVLLEAVPAGEENALARALPECPIPGVFAVPSRQVPVVAQSVDPAVPGVAEPSPWVVLSPTAAAAAGAGAAASGRRHERRYGRHRAPARR